MAQQTVKQQKNMRARIVSIQQEVRRDMKAWGTLDGVWRNKKVMDPVVWQKKIRKEWDRRLP